MFDDIKKFHEKFELPSLDKPGFLTDELMEFRIKFMQEELEEFISAHKKYKWYEIQPDKDKEILDMMENSLADAFDALIDLTYVALGTAYLMNLPFNDGWREVHHCNMQKVRAKVESESKRRSTYDVVKPRGWKAPDLKSILNGEK